MREVIWMVVWTLHFGAIMLSLRWYGEAVWFAMGGARSFGSACVSTVALISVIMPAGVVALGSIAVWPFVVMNGGVSRLQAKRLCAECVSRGRLPRMSTDGWSENPSDPKSDGAWVRTLFGAMALAAANAIVVAPALMLVGRILQQFGLEVTPASVFLCYWLVGLVAARRYRPQSSLLWSLALPIILTAICVYCDVRGCRRNSSKDS